MTLRRLTPLLTIAATLLPACTYFQGNPRVLITSEPQGAVILLDGEDTGRTTPAVLELGGMFGSDHVVTLEKDGFEPESRSLEQRTTTRTSRWIDGGVDNYPIIAFPFWWTLGDWFLPFEVNWQYVPQEIYVRLYPVGEAPVHFDPAAEPN